MGKYLSHEEKCKIIEDMYVWLFKLTLYIGLNFHDAQDVVQDACLRFLQYDVKKASYLTKTTINLSFALLKKRKYHLPLDVCLSKDANFLEPWALIHRKNTFKIIRKSIMLLDEKSRTLIILRYFGGLSTKEISERLSMNLKTVLSRLHRARKQLEKFLP